MHVLAISEIVSILHSTMLMFLSWLTGFRFASHPDVLKVVPIHSIQRADSPKRSCVGHTFSRNESNLCIKLIICACGIAALPAGISFSCVIYSCYGSSCSCKALVVCVCGAWSLSLCRLLGGNRIAGVIPENYFVDKTALVAL